MCRDEVEDEFGVRSRFLYRDSVIPWFVEPLH